ALCPACLFRAAATDSDEGATRELGVSANWRVLSILGATEHGTVYMVEDEDRERDGEYGELHLCATRVSMAGSGDRLVLERRRLLALRHRAIVPMLDAGLTDSAQLYVVFEHVRGRLLPEYLGARRREDEEIETLFNE